MLSYFAAWSNLDVSGSLYKWQIETIQEITKYLKTLPDPAVGVDYIRSTRELSSQVLEMVLTGTRKDCVELLTEFRKCVKLARSKQLARDLPSPFPEEDEKDDDNIVGYPRRLRDGNWGVGLSVRDKANEGDVVTVKSQRGKKWEGKLTKCVGSDKFGTLWESTSVKRDYHNEPRREYSGGDYDDYQGNNVWSCLEYGDLC